MGRLAPLSLIYATAWTDAVARYVAACYDLGGNLRCRLINRAFKDIAETFP
jgi:hypothetical protein